jgi:ribosomal protein S18 acetylase RimI-like enzyme
MKDVDTVCAQRLNIFLEDGRAPELMDRAMGPFRSWLESRLRSGQYLGWLVEQDGKPFAGCGLMFIDWAPGPSHPESDRRGFILNLWVDPARRGQGWAKALMKRIEAEAHARDVHYLVLHASKLGRGLYEALNWRPTNEMSLVLSPEA